MVKTYLIISPDGYPLVWRMHDVQGSVRLYEDGMVGEAHRQLAIQLGYGTEFQLLRLESSPAARQYVEERVKELVWIHLFPLPFGYNDKYAYSQEQ